MNISIIGSTGSIGTQTLDIVERFPERYRVVALTAGKNWEKLLCQIKKFRPLKAAVADDKAFRLLKENLPSGCSTEILSGDDGICHAASMPESELCVVSSVGISGLKPVLSALNSGKQLALATKEALVSGGELVMKTAVENGIMIRPIDSEHSAIFQCIGSGRKFLSRIILTCSGGALRKFPAEKLGNASVSDVLAHPNWSMGKKITVDCATLMNKGFELIEACHLFSVAPDDVEIVVHPQSIIHSMAEFSDGSTLAQMSLPDMRIAIQYALSYPERLDFKWKRTDFLSLQPLTFEKPDYDRFPCLKLAIDSFRSGGTLPASLNAANEEAVYAFLRGEINFGSIYDSVREVIESSERLPADCWENISYADYEARRKCRSVMERLR